MDENIFHMNTAYASVKAFARSVWDFAIIRSALTYRYSRFGLRHFFGATLYGISSYTDMTRRISNSKPTQQKRVDPEVQADPPES